MNLFYLFFYRLNGRAHPHRRAARAARGHSPAAQIISGLAPQLAGVPARAMGPDSPRLAAGDDWPGNVRQLLNVVALPC